MLRTTYSPKERRRHSRTQLDITLQGIRLDPDGGDVLNSLRMIDISKSGMGVLSDRPLYRGQRLVLALPFGVSSERRNVYASVVHYRSAQDNYHVGLEFDRASVGNWCGINGAVAAA